MFIDTMKSNTMDTSPHQSQHMEHWQLIASGVAHDFNNLLTSILGQSTLALRQLPDEALARRHIEKVIKAAEFATKLTDQLLTYSNGSQGHVNTVNLNTLIHDNLNLLDATFFNGISIQLELASDLPVIRAKDDQLHQVVMNLLINAAEAIQPGEGTITIKTGSERIDGEGPHFPFNNDRYHQAREREYAFIKIQDTGVGMDMTTLSRIFEPFFTTKPSGRGLGLAAIHEIVRDHHGQIDVNSRLGQGTTFTIYFPCDQTSQSSLFPLQ